MVDRLLIQWLGILIWCFWVAGNEPNTHTQVYKLDNCGWFQNAAFHFSTIENNRPRLWILCVFFYILIFYIFVAFFFRYIYTSIFVSPFIYIIIMNIFFLLFQLVYFPPCIPRCVFHSKWQKNHSFVVWSSGESCWVKLIGWMMKSRKLRPIIVCCYFPRVRLTPWPLYKSFILISISTMYNNFLIILLNTF